MSPTEISILAKNSLEFYLSGLTKFSEVEFKYKFSEEEWSLCQLYQHLLETSTFFFLANVRRCMEQRKGNFAEIHEKTHAVLAKNEFPVAKIKVPNKEMENPKCQEIKVYKNHMDGILKSLPDYQKMAEQADPRYCTLHPLFGPLNASAFYQMFEMHLSHHKKQLLSLQERLFQMR